MIGNSIAGFLGTGVAASTTSYESIATAAGTGASASITFSSIPSTYKHLQIRAIARTASGTGAFLQYNSDTGTNYTRHYVEGNGTAASSGSGTSTTKIDYIQAVSNANINGVNIVDILDYTNTNKYKTTRILQGYDANGTGNIGLGSGLWMSTSAISTITITTSNGANFATTTQFALYGIKG
jgi:hypothetical protein